MASPRLYLIDAYSIIFRAFYAIRNLSTSTGEPSNAVYGFVQMLRKLLRDHQPGFVGLAFDVSSRTVRKEQYEEYKANRSPMPDDLRSQIPLIRKAIAAFRIPILEFEGYEADDVLGTVSRKAALKGYEVVLISADKDLMQLVDSKVSMLHTGRDKLYDPASVEEDFGVPPQQVIDVLALMGDSSDNIPGVPGIGEKGAKALIQEYGSLANLIEHAGELKRKAYREGLEQHADLAFLSKDLVTIHTDLDVDFDPKSLAYEPPDSQGLADLYREMEFFTLLKELEDAGDLVVESDVNEAREVKDAAEALRRLVELTGRLAVAAVGTEATGLAIAAALGSLTQGSPAPEGPAGETIFLDFRRPGLREVAAAQLGSWLNDPECVLVGHDLKEVMRLADPAIRPQAKLDDTMILSWLLPSSVRSYALEEVAMARLQVRPMTLKEAGWSLNTEPEVGSQPLLHFAGERAQLAARLADGIAAEMTGDGGDDRGSGGSGGRLDADSARQAEQVYRRFEEPLLPVLLRMEETGVLLDCEFLGKMSIELEAELAGLESEIYELAGEQFNINSPAQLGTIMFEKLGYPVVKRTKKTKSYSTGAETLEALAAQGFDLPERILRFRESAKLKSTYVDALPLLVAADGRLHTRFQQAVAATGRLSSTNPNLQNIPIRTDNGRRIRTAFRAPEGRQLLVADYSQIELRVLAHIAQEPALAEAFRRGEDIHASTAATVFGGSPELVSSEQRRAAKVINFGILYGMSPFGLANNLGIPQREAKSFIEAYLERFPAVKRYMDSTVAGAEQTGRVETLYGRARWLPDIQSKNWNLRENAKRMAINARIQGTSADLLKLAMIAVDRRLFEEFPGASLLLTVHDELVLEVADDQVARAEQMVREAMEGVADLDVPLAVELGSGRDWGSAKA